MHALGHLSSPYVKLLSKIYEAGGTPCEAHPDVFFPEDYSDPEDRLYATKVAKAICQTCPIMNECFEYALETNQMHGVWGGTSASER